MLYEYPSNFSGNAKCDLEIIRSPGRVTLVICTELEDNPGTSVTNAAERIATRPCHEDPAIDPEGLIWVEHYPERSAGPGRTLPESWDMVTFTYHDDRTFRRPEWRYTTVEAVQGIRERVEASRQTSH